MDRLTKLKDIAKFVWEKCRQIILPLICALLIFTILFGVNTCCRNVGQEREAERLEQFNKLQNLVKEELSEKDINAIKEYCGENISCWQQERAVRYGSIRTVETRKDSEERNYECTVIMRSGAVVYDSCKTEK